eukprot:TRINITY_DN2992_c1_g2_i1.p1 TRINITY_DN2992_c1_g2~~TRINITY_DN2992_c1_g2_i1.p1  ORF type:complete len:711 (+),score=304.94 TRINITY_DN2992_c1_g2_i1:79-2211(+)
MVWRNRHGGGGHQRSSSLTKFLNDVFYDKKTIPNFDPEDLTQQERVSRMLHTLRAKAKIGGPGSASIFEHFLVVGAPSPLTDSTQPIDPQILYYYPNDKPPNLPGVADFCFPDKVINIPACKYDKTNTNSISPDNASAFVLTTEDATNYYGIALCKDFFIQGRISNNEPISQVDSSPDSSKPNSPGSPSNFALFTPRCYCIITKFPFFRFHLDLLYSLFELEELISHKIIEEENVPAVATLRPHSPRTNNNNNAFASIKSPKKNQNRQSEILLFPSTSSDSIFSEFLYQSQQSQQNHQPQSQPQSQPQPQSQSQPQPQQNHLHPNYHSNRNSIIPGTHHLFSPSSSSSSPLFSQDINTQNEQSKRSSLKGPVLLHFIDSMFLKQPYFLRQIEIIGYLHTILENYLRLEIPENGATLTFHIPSCHLIDLNAIRKEKIEFLRPFEQDGEEEELFAEWSLPLLFNTFSRQTLLQILSCVLLEKQIIFVYPSVRILSALVLSWTALLRPFAYHSVLIPILPTKMFSFLEAPVPFIVGTTKLPELCPPDVIVINVSKKKIESSQLIPLLPNITELKKKIEPYIKELDRTKEPNLERPYVTTEEQYTLLRGISTNFQIFFSNLFANFYEHTLRDCTDSNNPITVFLKESFLAAQSNDDIKFMKPFCETQMFLQFSDQCLRTRDKVKTTGSLNSIDSADSTNSLVIPLPTTLATIPF